MTKRTFSKKGENTRQELVDAAYKLFTTQGYHATSMRKIADKAGLVVGGVYNHFASKEELFKTVINERHPFRQILPYLSESQGSTVEEILRDTVTQMIKIIDDDPELTNLFFIEFIEFDGKHLNEVISIFVPQIMEFGKRLGKAEGQLRSNAPLAFFRTMLGTVIMYFLTDRVLTNSLIPKGMMGSLDDILDNFLYGVLDNGG